jgi:hypothetical protein
MQANKPMVSKIKCWVQIDWVIVDYELEYNPSSKIISPHFKKAGLLMVALQCCFNAN